MKALDSNSQFHGCEFNHIPIKFKQFVPSVDGETTLNKAHMWRASNGGYCARVPANSFTGTNHKQKIGSHIKKRRQCALIFDNMHCKCLFFSPNNSTLMTVFLAEIDELKLQFDAN